MKNPTYKELIEIIREWNVLASRLEGKDWRDVKDDSPVMQNYIAMQKAATEAARILGVKLADVK